MAQRLRQTWFQSLSVLLGLLLIAMILQLNQQAPSPRSVDAEATDFAAGRALLHLKQIAKRPHPAGSRAHAELRRYILKESRRLGYQPSVQSRLYRQQDFARPSRFRHLPNGFPMHNIIVRVPGYQSSGTIVVCAHYDSAHNAPGAGDNGAAVAAALESMRALRAQPQLRNDVVFLFSDAEERGLWGAELFMRYHPLAKKTKLVLNFDARGSRGPSLMFQTSPGNARLIQALAHADKHPRATSLAGDVYRLLPNDTDFTIFLRAGVKGLNFAFIQGIENYHRPTDTLKNLSHASLQHHGEHMLAMVQQFGASDLVALTQPAPDLVYFELVDGWLFRYDHSFAGLLVLFSGLLLLALTSLGLSRRQLRGWRSLLWGLGLPLVWLSFLGCLHLANVAVLGWKGKTLYRMYKMVQYDLWLLVIWMGVLATAIAAIFVATRRWLTAHEQNIGGLWWWWIVSLASIVYLPGASYLFTWPLLFAILAILAWDRRHRQHAHTKEEEASLCPPWWLCLIEWPSLLLWIPVLYHLHYGLTINLAPAGLLFLAMGFSISPVTRARLLPHQAPWFGVLACGTLTTALAIGWLVAVS